MGPLRKIDVSVFFGSFSLETCDFQRGLRRTDCKNVVREEEGESRSS